MATTQERMRILSMLQEGKLDAEAAAQLLEALGDGEPQQSPLHPAPRHQHPSLAWAQDPAALGSPAAPGDPAAPREPAAYEPAAFQPGKKARWLRVRVTDVNSGRPRVNVRMPLSMVNLGLKIGAHFAPEMEGLDLAEMMRVVQEGEAGAFVDVVDHEDGEHVEVFLE